MNPLWTYIYIQLLLNGLFLLSLSETRNTQHLLLLSTEALKTGTAKPYLKPVSMNEEM